MAVISLLAVSCSKDGEILTATVTGNGTQIGSADNNIVLDIDSPSSLALTIWWDELGNATLSNPNAQFADNFVVNAIQFSASEDFSDPVETVVDNNAVAVQFTTAQLNSIVTSLGIESGTEGTVHIRMRTALGTGVGAEETFGNSISIKVTPYFIDMSFITLAGTDGTSVTIPAAEEGSYAGFAPISSGWWNFFFNEGDGTIWGAVPDAGQFVLEQKSDMTSWNTWFPEPTGCYYITMSTSAATWSATAINGATATLSGSDAVSMKYSSSHNAYTAVLNPSSEGQGIQVDLEGTLYDGNNGDGTASSMSLVASGNSLSVGEAGTSTCITSVSAGTCTLILYLSDMTWELAEGEVDIDGGGEDPGIWPEDPDYSVASSDFLYLYNLTDNNPSSVAGRLGKTADGIYEGFQYLGGWQNFKFGDSEDFSAAKIYGSVPSNSLEGALYRLYCGEDMFNIWYDNADASYLYLTADLNERNWSSTVISSISLVGDFNGWDAEADVLSFDPADRTWSAVVTPGSWGEYGIQFYINGSWEWKYSPDGNGQLIRAENAAVPEIPVEEGKSYTVTLDLNDPAGMTYTIEEYQENTDPEYNEFFYMFYTWATEGYWQERLASVLRSPDQNGVYSGFFSTADSWDAPYAQFTFGSVATPNTGIKYGLDNNTSLVEGGGTNGWTDDLGLYEITASLIDMTVTQEYLGKPQVVDTDSGTRTQMAFSTTGFVWEATCTFNAGGSFRITAGEDDGAHAFGGSDGVLTDGGNAITVAEAGTYLIHADLSDASHLTYTMTLQ